MKIVIYGNTGSGKSTLAKQISEIKSIPVYHLDKILWKPGWVRCPELEYRQKHQEIINKKEWIIEGVGYESCWEDRNKVADVIIFLDPPLKTCKEQALQRMKEDLERPNPYVPNNCPYPITMKAEQYDLIEKLHVELNPKFLSIIQRFSGEKMVYHLESKNDITSLLEKIIDFQIS